MIPVRRSLLKGGAAMGALIVAPALVRAQSTPQRQFAPMPGEWRTFEVTTRVELADPVGATRIWLPVPSIDSDWQKSLESSYTSNGSARLVADGVEGARMVQAEFAAGVKPVVEVTSRVQTRNRADLAGGRRFEKEDATTLRHYTRATHLLPTDGIVRQTALKATQGAKTDVDKARARPMRRHRRREQPARNPPVARRRRRCDAARHGRPHAAPCRLPGGRGRRRRTGAGAVRGRPV